MMPKYRQDTTMTYMERVGMNLSNKNCSFSKNSERWFRCGSSVVNGKGYHHKTKTRFININSSPRATTV